MNIYFIGIYKVALLKLLFDVHFGCLPPKLDQIT